jgi:uncharacterized protein YecE (DUF72 family)
VDGLRKNNISLVLSDDYRVLMPTLCERVGDLRTADFTYIRYVGEGRKMEQRTRVWDPILVDRGRELMEWNEFIRTSIVGRSSVFAYATNYYEGHAPATASRVLRLLKGDRIANMKNAEEQATLFRN